VIVIETSKVKMQFHYEWNHKTLTYNKKKTGVAQYSITISRHLIHKCSNLQIHLRQKHICYSQAIYLNTQKLI